MGFGNPPAIPRTGGQYARSATLTVAASNSIDNIDVDYVCDGTDDQVEINAAITALGATGGTVMLLEGTYNITASINLASNVTLMGQGAGTVLRIPNGHNANLNVISAVSVNRVIVADLRIDGNRANQAAGNMNGIYFDTATYSTIARCWVENLYVGGSGIYLTDSWNNTVTGNTCRGNGYHGIRLDASNNNNTITGNTCQSNDSHGIVLSVSSNNTVTGNNCQSNAYYGIRLDSSSNNNTITGNTVQSNGYHGIYLDASNNNTITGNTVVGNSQATDNTYDGIYLTNSDYNNVQGNTVRHAGGANQHRYGINIADATCDGNLVINNDLYQAGRTLDYSDAGTGTIDRFRMSQMPDGAAGTVLAGQGLGISPAYNALALLPDTRGRTIVVTASNSIDPTLTPAAYRCDGVNDQVEINAAITALGATGGTVMLLEGTYNITASINLASNVTLMGQGAGTVLFIPNGHNVDLNVISAVSVNHVLVADLRIDGNKANQTAGVMNGIYFDTVTYSTIARCWVENLYVDGDAGIRLENSNNNTVTGNNCSNNDDDGIDLYSSNNNTITDNNVQSSGWNGIWLTNFSNNNTITGNTCQSNYYGIILNDSCNNNTVTGNTCQSNSDSGIYLDTTCQGNTVTGNNCSNNYYGIYLSDSSNNNTITGNTCQSNYYGIYLYVSSNNTVTGNTCQGNSYGGIILDISSNNTVTGNTVVGNSQDADNTYDGILVTGNSDYNNIQGNTVRHAGGANRHRYGININTWTCDDNLVINNDLYLAGRTLDYSDAGTGTEYHNNRLTAGWVP